MPDLLADIEELEREVERLRDVVREARTHLTPALYDDPELIGVRIDNALLKSGLWP
jgi:hypothetical protein